MSLVYRNKASVTIADNLTVVQNNRYCSSVKSTISSVAPKVDYELTIE